MKTRIGIRTLLTTLTAFSLLAAPAMAAEGKHGGGRASYEKVSARVDANHDGKLQTSELPSRLAGKMGGADTNRDGVVAREEFAAQKAKMHQEHRAQLDTNKDGKVSPEERAAHTSQRFQRLDTNKDGQISEKEAPKGKWKRMSRADSNGNGSVSLSELEARRAAHGKDGEGRKQGRKNHQEQGAAKGK